MSNILTSILKKIGPAEYAEPQYFGTRPAYVSASQGVELNNLEEQLFLGVSKITTSWKEDDGQTEVIKTEYRTKERTKDFYYTLHYKFSEAKKLSGTKANFGEEGLSVPSGVFDEEDALSVYSLEETLLHSQSYEFNDNGELIITNNYSAGDLELVLEVILLCYCKDCGEDDYDEMNDLVTSRKKIFRHAMIQDTVNGEEIFKSYDRELVESLDYVPRSTPGILE